MIMKLKQFFIRVLMLLGLPFTILSAFWLKIVVNFGIGRITDKIFMRIGVLPIIDQYYQPLINPKKYLKKSIKSVTSKKIKTQKITKYLSTFAYTSLASSLSA